MKKLFLSLFFFICIGLSTLVKAQTGISVSPPRVYFELNPGQSGAEKVTVTNVSANNNLELAVSLGDWKYNNKGENLMYPPDSLANSCAAWVTIKKEDSYFVLKPGEKKDITINLTTPNTLTKDVPVHTAMLYVSQMNPVDDVDEKGANIKVSVRSGIKLLHRTPITAIKKLEIQNLSFDKSNNSIVLSFENNGNTWTDGIIYVDLLNSETGKKTEMNQLLFYSMPGDKRTMDILLPTNLEKGKYVATVLMDHGDENNLEVAELTFSYE